MELVVPVMGQELINDCDKCLNNSISQGTLDRSACLERAKHRHRSNRRPRQFGGHVIGNPGETDNLYMQHLAGSGRTLKVETRVVLQSENQSAAHQRLFQRVGVHRQLITNACANQIGSVGIKPLLHKEVDLA